MKITALNATRRRSPWTPLLGDRVTDHTGLMSLSFVQRAIQSWLLTRVGMSTEVVHDLTIHAFLRRSEVVLQIGWLLSNRLQ